MKFILFLVLRYSPNCFCAFFGTISNTVQNAGIKIYQGREYDCFKTSTSGLNVVGNIVNTVFVFAPSKDFEVKFFMRSGISPKHQILVNDTYMLLNADLIPRKKTVIIVHGFLSNSGVDWIKDMEEAFLKWGDVNVMTVDWKLGSENPTYVYSARNTRYAGLKIARVIENIVVFMVRRHGFSSLGQLYCIGHSLGAHVCGVAANELKKKCIQCRIDRITGLDPALPCFGDGTSLELKLDKSDARFVDIIHTNGGRLGNNKPIGHIDFYPNGGVEQPGCSNFINDWIQGSQFRDFPIRMSQICNHGRAHRYFIDSLEGNCRFFARPCFFNGEKCVESPQTNGFAEMGINSINYQNQIDATFHLATSDKEPFCDTRKDVTPTQRQQSLGYIGSIVDAANRIIRG